jgi:hypothetical protein
MIEGGRTDGWMDGTDRWTDDGRTDGRVWMGVDGCGWVWMGVDGCGWVWMGTWAGVDD